MHCKYGGYQLPSSASPQGPYFPFVLRTCSDVTICLPILQMPVQPPWDNLFFNGDQNLENHGISTRSSLLYFLPILPYPKIALNILHLAMIAYFQSNFASITKNFYYSKIQYCLNVPPTIMIFVKFNDWFIVIK